MVALTNHAWRLSDNKKVSLPSYSVVDQNLCFRLLHKPVYDFVRVVNLLYYSGFYDNGADASSAVVRATQELGAKGFSMKHMSLMLILNGSELLDKTISSFNNFVDR